MAIIERIEQIVAKYSNSLTHQQHGKLHNFRTESSSNQHRLSLTCDEVERARKKKTSVSLSLAFSTNWIIRFDDANSSHSS